MSSIQSRNGTGKTNYSDSLSCAMCYSKHLAKAAVEYREYTEDQTRHAEFALAVGDAACAEDHAYALGMDSDAARIRGIRERMWSGDASVSPELVSMAASAVSEAMRRSSEESAEIRARAREAFARTIEATKLAQKAKADESNDSGPSVSGEDPS